MKRVKTHRNVSKSRMLPPALGKPYDKLYWASTGSFYPGAMTKEQVSAMLKDMYNAGTIARATSVYPYTTLLPGGESINTTVGRVSGMNNCTHVKQQHVCYPVTSLTPKWDRPALHYKTPLWRYETSSPYWKDAVNCAISHGVANDLGFSARAYWSMRPKFQSEISLINSIFELKDFSDVASMMFGANPRTNHAVRETAGALKTLSRAFDKSPVSTGIKLSSSIISKTVGWMSRPGVVVSDVTKLAASAQLTYSLAVMPTIRDVMAIHAEAQKDVYKLAKDFKDYGDEGSRSHYSEHDVLQDSLIVGSHNNYCFGEGKYVKRTLTATMVSYYRVLWERLEDRYPKWWGLEIGVDEVWNMLPMSFVLDYVWTVGKSLDYMDRDDSVDITSTEYCESVKVVASSGLHFLQDSRTLGLMISGVEKMPRSKRTPHLVTGASGSYYQRTVKEPYRGPALPKLKAPSSAQAANLLALARCLLF